MRGRGGLARGLGNSPPNPEATRLQAHCAPPRGPQAIYIFIYIIDIDDFLKFLKIIRIIQILLHVDIYLIKDIYIIILRHIKNYRNIKIFK